MKKAIKSIMMLFVASSFMLASCGTDTEVKDVDMTLIQSTSGTMFFTGDTLKVTVSASGNSDNKLKNLTITKAVTNKPTITWLNKVLSGTDAAYVLMDTLTSEDVGTITYTITLTGEKGTAQTKTLTISVAEVNCIDVAASPVQLFSHMYDGPRFCKLTTFETYSEIDSANNYSVLANDVDLISYYGSTNGFTISSPDDAVMQGLYSGFSKFWTSGKARTTGLVKVTGQTQFSVVQATNDDRLLITLANGKTYGQTVTKLAVNDLILFKTKEGKLGLLKVNSINLNTTKAEQAQFDALVQFDCRNTKK